MSAYSYTSSKSKLKYSSFDSSAGGGTGGSSRLSIGSSAYDTGTGTSRLDTSTSRYGSSRLDSLSTRLDKSPSRYETDDTTSSALKTSRYDTSGSTSRYERTSKYAAEDTGSAASKYERSSRYSIADDTTGASSRLDRTSRYSVTESSDLDAAPSRWDRTTSRYVTETTAAEPEISSYKSRFSSRYSTDSADLDTGTSRYERSSKLTRGTSELSDTGSTHGYRTSSRYAIESLDTPEAPSSERYEQRLLAELELDTKPSRWAGTSSRYTIESPDTDTDYSRLDRKSTRLTTLTTDVEEPSKYDRTSRYVSDYSSELDTSSPKWESEYSSQYNKWDTTGTSRLDKQSARQLSTESTELDAGLSRWDRTSRIDRQSSRSSELDTDSSYKKSSKLETLQSYGVLTEPIEGSDEPSNLVRTSSGIIRATVRRESEQSEVDSTPAKPKVQKTIKSISQTEGHKATLECEILGYPRPSVQWLKENEVIKSQDRFQIGSEGTRHYLIINDLRAEDVGLYTVAATNNLGTSSSSAAINVLPDISSPRTDSRPTSPGGTFLPTPPKFKVKLKDTELMDQTTVRFELIVRGMPIPTVTFYKDDQVLKEDNRIKVLFESKEVFELMIEHVTETDQGVYKCVAINSEGKDETSGRITVTKNKIVFPGIDDNAPLEYVKADSLSPRSRSPVFKWFKDGKEFEASERFQVQFDDEEDTITLVFQHVKPEDAGLYTCAASTSSGKISCSAELTVQGLINQLPRDPIPPTIKLAMADVEVSEGASAMLEAKVSAFPRPRIAWFRGQQLIEIDERHKFLYEDEESYTLVIKNTRKEDQGLYRIEAVNDLGSAQTSAKLSVNVAPKFKKQLIDQSVMTDECLKLEVQIDANPAADVKWFKDGQQIIERKGIKILNEKQNTFDLIIEKVKIEDSGNYSCVATNELGQQTAYSLVKVNAPPVFKSKLENIDALEGQRAELIVKVTGSPKPDIKFFKNEKVIKADSSRVVILEEDNGTVKLVIKETDSSDSGKYKCTATNEWGEESSEAELTVKKNVMKPNFTKKLRDCEAREGDQMIEFNVVVEGIPKPDIKWFREGLEIKEKDGFKFVEENNSYTLILKEVKPENAGTYKCEATNSEGSAQTSGLLTVNTPPQFIKKLVDKTVRETETVKLEVKVVGCPQPDIKWYKEETIIKSTDKRLRYEEDSNEFTLLLDNTTADDSGVYKVVAENVFGKCESKGKLTVESTSSRPTFTQVLTDKEAIECESNIEFVVKTDSQKSKPIIKWFINEQEITKSDKRYQLIADEERDTYKLVIKSATEETVGRYKCTATNTSGTADTSAKFDIITKPKFIKGLEDIEAVEGQTVSMTVQVKGTPEPEVKFLKNGRDVSAEATVVVKKEIDDIYILEIENIRIIMSGEYQCQIKNKAGEALSNGTVVVNTIPKFVKDLEDKDSWVNENVVLEVVVTGSPNPEITWFKDGKKVDGTERVILESREESFKLKLDNASVDDTGVYKCRARNKSGETQSKEAKVSIKEVVTTSAPVFTKHIADSEAVIGDAVRFEAKVVGNPKPEVIWTKNGTELKPNNKIKITEEPQNLHILIIKDLQITDSSTIECKAQNSKGQAIDKARLVVQEPESPTITGLSDVAVVEESPAKLEAKITGIPKPIVNWYRDSEPVSEDLIFNEPENDLYSIRFKTVTEDLIGKYVCNASNVAGDAQQSAELSINGSKPKFLKELEDVITMSVEKENGKLVLGQSVVFEAEVTGVPHPKVTWLKNGKEIVPSDRVTINNVGHEYTLEIKSIARDDVASYVCRAVNEHGGAKSVCLLKFQDTPHPPIVKKELPPTVTVEEGQQLVLVAQVDGEPIPSTQWMKNGQPIEQTDDIKIKDRADGTTTLTVDVVTPEHAAQYSVKAVNFKGEAMTSTSVNVEPPKRKPTFAEKLPKSLSIEEGQPLELNIKVDALPVAEIKWLKDDTPLKTSDNIVIDIKPDGTQSLCIKNTKPKDSGVYTIRATNECGQTVCSTAVQISCPQMAPIFEKKLPQSLTIDSGKPLELEVKLKAEPMPDIKWTKDGIDIKIQDNFQIETKPDGTFSLTKPITDTKDTGKYELTASNPLGKISTASKVEVKPTKAVDVFVEKLPQTVNVVEGQALKLVAKVDGKPDVKWTKDGKPIKPSDGIKIETKPDGTVALSVDCAKGQHSGQYAVTVKTDKGDVISSTDVNVGEATTGLEPKQPKIETQFPKLVDVTEGKSLILTAKVEGQPLDVKWLKDDLPIKQSDSVKIETKPDGTVELCVAKTKAQDSGKYTLIVENPFGEVRASTDVDVQKGPVITDKLPEKVEVQIDKPMELVAKVDGKPTPKVEWAKDGVPIKESEGFKIETKTDGTVVLSVDQTKPETAGDYSVIVKTSTGDIVSSTRVDVQKGPVISDKLPDYVDVIVGQALNLAAKVVTDTKPDVKWTKDGVPIKETDGVKVVTKPDGTVELCISSAQPTDTGKYALIAKTSAGEAVSESSVDVQFGPIFREQLPETLNVVEGKPVDLFARVDGNPTPEVNWTKDGVPIESTEGIVMKSKPDGAVSLLVESAKPSDTGKYALIAKSPSGEVVSVTDVEVKKGPIIKEKLPEYLNLNEGQPLLLVVKSEGTPFKSVQWAKDGVPIKPKDGIKVETQPNGNISLSIDNAQPSDSGKYELLVKTDSEVLKTSSEVNVAKSEAKPPEVRPKFAKNLEITEGKPLVLEANIEGQPLPDVKWLKDDVPIQQSDSCKIETKPDGTTVLKVDSTQQKDSGVYTVVVESPLGEVRASSAVQISKGPLIAQKLPQKVEVVVGKPLILTAKVDGVPTNDVKWSKDGVPIKAKDGIKIESKPDGTVELSIDKTQTKDAGDYALTVKSKTVDIVSSSKVEVQKGPVIIEKLPDYLDAIVGKPIHLEAKVDGLPEPIVKWTKDAKRLEPSDGLKIESKPDGTVSLTIECAQPLDLGKYALIAKNSAGEAVSECDVDVQIGPIIREKLPEALNITEGKPFELIAKVDGSPLPEVKWTKDGVPIEEMEGIVIKSKPDGTVALSIDCAQSEDTGRYSVIAKSPSGEVVSKSEVDVRKGPIIREKLPEFLKIDEGFPLKLMAKVEGQPIIEAKWAKDGVPLKLSDRIVSETKPNGNICLSIESTQPSDAGKYALIVQTPDQDLTTASDVNVVKSHSKEPEVIAKFPEKVDVVEGKPLKLSAQITGEPKPEVRWLKDNYPLEVSKSVKIESLPDGTVALTIGSAKPQDSGKYTLIAENPLGEVKASTDVDVQKGPVVTQKLPENIDVVVGKPLTLTAKIDGEPKPTVEWTKDGVPLRESEGIKLETKPDGTVQLKIDSVKPDNTGQYALVAKSALGEVSSLSNVDVLTGPVIIEKLPESIDVIAGQPLKLRAKVDAQQTPLVKWTKDGIRVQPSDHLKIESNPDGTVSLSIDCAQLNDTGIYAIVAKTRDGEDMSSSNVFVQKGPVIIEGLPESISLSEGKPLSLTAKFDGKPGPEVTWFKDNIPIKATDDCQIKTKPDGTTTLTIGSALAKDSGEYAVIAKSPSGEAMSLSNVDVKKGPVFIQKLPEAVKVIAGKPINLVAKIEGLPVVEPRPPIVSWVKDGYPVVFSDKVKFGTKPNGTVCLSIDCSKPKDTGKYAVIAKTPEGEIVSTSAVSVLTPPTFKDSLPKTLDVVEGKPLRLCAKVDSDGIPQISWTKNGVPIEPTDGIVMKTKPDGTVFLEIACAQLTDSGEYAVVAKTASGQCKSSADVSVQKGLIIIDSLPHSVSVCEGRPLQLSVKIDGKPPPEVTWIKDGIPIKQSEGVEIRAKPDGTYMLTIGSAKSTDSGEYCMIARILNEEVVAVTNVEVEKGPVFREKLPERVSAVVGKPLELTAKIECDAPIDKIIWTKDGVPIRPTDDLKMKQRPDGTVCLSIDCAKLSDSGKYAVFAKVGNRGVGSMSVVSVIDAPVEKAPEKEEPEEEVEEEEISAEFKDRLPKSLNVDEGSPLKLVAKIARKGERIPSFNWTKNGKPVEDSDRVKRESTPNGTVSLKIDSALLSDAGNYMLSFKTGDGVQTSAVLVQITPKSTVEQPAFIKGLTRISAEEGKPCRLEAKVSGDIDSIVWYKNGQKISADQHYGFVKESDGTIALLIDSVKSDDSAEYRVEIVNSCGTADSSASLKVVPKPKEKPTFIEELKPAIVNEREKLVLKAVFKSDLPVTIKWMKDGFEISSTDSRIQLDQTPEGTVTLTIESAKMDDSGKYTVSVINDEGRVRCTGAVTVSSKASNKPEFIEGLIPCTLIAGETGKISVKVGGEPMPEVRFIKDGQQVIPNDRVHIRGQTFGRTELYFDEVRGEDEGNYIAVAVNDNGEVRSSAPVVVNRSPKFEKPLTDSTGIEGYPARIETKVDGRPKPDIKWMKDGQTLRPDDQHLKFYAGGDGTHAIIFDNCGPNDSGKYSVIATNDLGKSETSAQFLVKTKVEDTGPESAPIFVGGLQDVSAYEGQSLEFIAEVKANPIPDIKWYFNGQEIDVSDNIQISFDGTKARLKITKCEAKHKGFYELKISNRLGETSSKAKADIFGKSGPKFTQKFTDAEVGLSEPTKLICRVIGFPEPSIDWYCNGIRIEPGLHYSIIREMDLCTLLIVRATEKMTGTYECRAKNECGSDSCKATITFIDTEARGEAASFFKKMGDCEVREGKTAKFTACVTGSPKPEIKWFKGGVEFEPLSSSSKYSVEYQRNGLIRFEIRNVEQKDLGEYRCHAMNTHGYDNSIATLKFESLDDIHKRRPSADKLSDKFKKPSIPVPLPDRPRITRMTDNDLTLAWLPSVPIQPRFPVTYIVEFARIPDGEWIAYRTGIKDSQCDIDGLSPGEDYSFRTRVENKFGISDPSPSVTAFRSKLKGPFEPTDRRPRGYDLLHPPLDKQECAPMFLREHETYIYAIRGQPVTLEFWIYGNPDPKVIWQFEGEQIQTGSGSRFDAMSDRGGQNCLFITKMTENDVGWFTCVATNPHGTEMRRIKIEIAEPPVFIKRFEETTVLSRKHVRFECTVEGKPEPVVHWFKDWQPLGESDRVKILWETPDRATMFINGAIVKDAGLYSCSATNIAGQASISAMLHIEESELEFDKYMFGYNEFIKPKSKPFETYYDIGDELGRGTQGIIYHSVERSTGKSFASKMMHGKGQMKDYMMSELDIMNQLGYHPRVVRLWDAFTSTPHSLTLITDLCGGGELLHSILQKGTLTENEVALYIRQILEGIDYLHFKNIAHFGLTIGDILLDRVNGTDIKIADFGLAQRIIPGLKYIVEFGHPEFVAPEILDKQSASYVADVWSVGIITYILLTGISPFLAETDRSTLHNLQLGKIDFSLLTEISIEGRDFLTKVLEFDQYRRLDVKSALQHPWLRLGERPTAGTQLNCMENLRQYHKRWKNWYVNASCKTHYRRRHLHSCFTHPSRMIYPPDERYTPSPSPERDVGRSKFKPSQFDETYTQKISREGVDAHSESQYQSGPDTYLLQLRDTDFATRIRGYLRVGASRSPSLAASLRESHWGDSSVNTGYKPSVSVRERRKFTDIMDEEVGEEKRGLETRSKPMRLVREVGTSGYAYGQLHQLKKEAFVAKTRDTGIKANVPFFREKIKDIVIKENEDVVFSCLAVGDPNPSYTWFRNDGILIESSRIEVKRTEDGRCELRIKPARAYDVGHYKCVARNEEGAVVCRARLNLGDVPSAPDAPEINGGSNKEVYLCWSPPKHDGNSHIVCYRLEYQKPNDSKWTVIADNIMHEFFIYRNLEPETSYYFRISARNRFGWSPHSNASEMVKTLAIDDTQRLKVPRARIYRQTITEDVGRVIIDDQNSIPDIDYSRELNPIPLINEEHDSLYEFLTEISRGRFSVISNTRVKHLNKTLVSKVVLTQSENESGIRDEYDIMKSLANERIVQLVYASRGSTVFALVLEKLSGIDVLTFLSQRQKYSEEVVSRIILQVLDGIEYLHFRGICILELQPDNVVMVDQRGYDIKLCDFGNARRVQVSGSRVSINANPEYVAPELIKNEEVTTSADIWCVGVLTYILLSGFSPFRGSNDNETAQNVVYVRYMFDHLYPEITQEAIRFLLTVFKLTPHKRPTIEECADHKWLLPNEFMIKKRETAIFSSHKLAEFADQFHTMRSSSTPARLTNLAGSSLARSVSLQNDSFEEL